MMNTHLMRPYKPPPLMVHLREQHSWWQRWWHVWLQEHPGICGVGRTRALALEDLRRAWTRHKDKNMKSVVVWTTADGEWDILDEGLL
jgi:hypothetical protein